MADNNHQWLDFGQKILGWITGLIAFISALVGFMKLWQGETGLVTTLLLTIGIGGAWLGSVYVASAHTTEALVEGGRGTLKYPLKYPRWRPWALAGVVIIPLLAASGIGYHFYQRTQPPSKTILLVANFDGPEPQKYHVTDKVLRYLLDALAQYNDVKVEALGRSITEVGGSAVARVEGEKRKAAIVIWGWYGLTEQVVPLSVHFELLRPPKYMPELGPEAKGLVRTVDKADLESFTLQNHLAAEVAYLSLFSIGMAHYMAEDWDRAIACFNNALSHTAERMPALDQSTLYLYRGLAYTHKGDSNQAITDYSQAIQFKPDYVMAYNNRGNAYAAKGDYNRAIADYSQTIRLEPGCAVAYNDRAHAYAVKGDYARAIADYNQFIKLKLDEATTYINRGDAYKDKGDYDRAVAEYHRAIPVKADLANAYYNRGAAYVAEGDYDRAIADYDQAILLKSDLPEIYFDRAVAYKQRGEEEKAIVDFHKVLELSHDPLVLRQAGEQLKALGAK